MPVNQEMLKVAAELVANTSAPSSPSFWSKLFPPYEERMRLGQKSMRALMGTKPAKFGPPVKKSAALDLSPYVPGASLGAGAGALIGGVGGALFPGKKRRLMSALRGALAGAGVGGLAGGALSAYRPDMISGVYDRLGKFLSGAKDPDPPLWMNKNIPDLNKVEPDYSDVKQVNVEPEPVSLDIRVPNTPFSEEAAIVAGDAQPPNLQAKNIPDLNKVEPDYSDVKQVNVEPEPAVLNIQSPIPDRGPGPSVLEQSEFNDSTYARDPKDLQLDGAVTPDMLRRFRSAQSGAASVPDSVLINRLGQYLRASRMPKPYPPGYPKYFDLPAFEE